MVALSLISAADYFVAFWSKIDRRVRRRSAFVLSRRKRRAVTPEVPGWGTNNHTPER